MADTQSKELKVREKQEEASPAEQTTPGLAFTPAVEYCDGKRDDSAGRYAGRQGG